MLFIWYVLFLLIIMLEKDLDSNLPIINKFIYNVLFLVGISIFINAITIVGIKSALAYSVISLTTISTVSIIAFILSIFAFLFYIISDTTKSTFINSKYSVISFFIFTILTGIQLGYITTRYSNYNIGISFIETAFVFVGMSLYGYFTKKDLTVIGNIAFMSLIFIILASIINIFIGSGIATFIITIIGIITFILFTAYDMQKLKDYALEAEKDKSNYYSYLMLGCFNIYLNIINLFRSFLRLLND